MVHLSHGAGFVLEALHEVRLAIVRRFDGKYLDGDEAVEGLLPCLVNRTHASVAEQGEDFILRQQRLQVLHGGRLPLDVPTGGSLVAGRGERVLRGIGVGGAHESSGEL